MEIEMPERIERQQCRSRPPPEEPPEHPERRQAAEAARLAGGDADAAPKPPVKSLTIGAVCKSLEREFPDISISKIRYLEDQKLLTPRRTRGGYRLYSPGDVDRLRTILRLQRDEFLPLRVIRQELAPAAPTARSAASRSRAGARPARAAPRDRRRAREGAPLYRLADVLEETGAEASLVKRARGVRRHQGRAPRRRAVLRRHREGDHPRGGRARALRRRRAQPARVPHLGRPRGGAARADPGAGAAVAEPGAARARPSRRSRTWRRPRRT